MKQQYIGQRGSNRLILFFCGWGMDEYLLTSLQSDKYDLLCCFDYRNLNFDTTVLTGYKEIMVVAWSLGVWVASQVLPQTSLTVCRSVAINGTLTPIDDERGIPFQIFQGTIEHLDERGLRKFNRRMCNTAEDFETFLQVASHRSVDELKEELICLRNYILKDKDSLESKSSDVSKLDIDGLNRFSLADKEKDWKWSDVYLSLSDRIFPSENQQKAWEGIAPIETISEGHYCPHLFSELAGAYGQEFNQ